MCVCVCVCVCVGNVMRVHVLDLSLDMFGCRVVQKAIEVRCIEYICMYNIYIYICIYMDACNAHAW